MSRTLGLFIIMLLILASLAAISFELQEHGETLKSIERTVESAYDQLVHSKK